MYEKSRIVVVKAYTPIGVWRKKWRRIDFAHTLQWLQVNDENLMKRNANWPRMPKSQRTRDRKVGPEWTILHRSSKLRWWWATKNQYATVDNNVVDSMAETLTCCHIFSWRSMRSTTRGVTTIPTHENWKSGQISYWQCANMVMNVAKLPAVYRPQKVMYVIRNITNRKAQRTWPICGHFTMILNLWLH